MKAFTYPGPSTSIREAGLSIRHCPTERQVLQFSRTLVAALASTRLPTEKQYSIASEHIPSNSVLLASSNYAVPSTAEYICQDPAEEALDCTRAVSDHDGTYRTDTQWNCWIDFPKFHDLVQADSAVQHERVQESSSKHDNAVGLSKPADAFRSRLASKYTANTPTWALPNSLLGGFDPAFDTLRWINQRENRRQHEVLNDQGDEQLAK